jgi:tetratricopeptide (TPR) repeat protein
MAHKLFLQLLADPFMSAQQSSQGPQAAHTLLARAMLLLLVPGDNTSSSESEVKQARRDLAQACHQFDLTLQLPAAASGCAALPAGASSSGGECCELSTTTHMGSGGFKHAGKPATAGSSRRRATKRSQRGQEEERGNDAPIAEGAATAGAGPNSLLSAALCHCLLGLLLAQTAATIGSSSNTQASNAADDSRQPACDEDTAGVAADADSAQDGGPQMATDAWLQVGSRLHSGSVYLQTYLAAVQASSCAASAGSSSRSCGAVWYADEAALAMMQVWHVAALQDWCHCQQPCLQVLGQLLWTLSQPIAQHATQFIQLAQVQQQLSTEILTSRPWLMQLMQQQTMAQAAAAAEVRKGPGGAGHVDAAASMASTSTNGRSTDKQSSRISSTQFEGAEASQQQAECCCQLRAQARALQDAAMKLGQQSPKANGEASGWQCLTRVQAQLAAAEAALWSGDIAAAAAEAELALQTCRSVLGSTGSLPVLSWGGRHGHCSSQGTATQWLPVGAMTASGSTGLHWHALGLYMSGLWQLSGTLEAAGNPQDAVRLLKELRRLSGSRGVFSFAVLAQASLSSIYSRMAQPAKAAAAASAAVQLLQVLQGLQAAEPSPAAAGSCVFALASAAVASAQAAVALGGQQPAAAQEHTTQGLAVLEGLQAVHAGGGAGGVKQAGWRWVSQYVQLLQQRAECHALLQDTAAALAALQAAARLLASQHTPCSR